MLLSACDGSVVTPPQPAEPGGQDSPATSPPIAALEEGDSTYWVDNTLEFEYEGDTWRWERDQQMATEVSLYQNDVFVGTVEFEYEGSEVSAVRFLDSGSSGWMETDTDGTITATHVPGGGGCDPEWDPWCVYPESEIQGGDCDDEEQAMQDAAWEAVGASGLAGVAITAGGPGNPIALGFVGNASIKTASALSKLAAWIVCIM